MAVIIAISNVGLLWAQDLNVGVTLYEQAFQIDLKAQSRQDFEKANSLESQSRAMDGMAWILQLFGDNTRAKDLYSKKLKLAENLRYDLSRSQTLYALGILNKDLANYLRGSEFFNLALVDVKKGGNKNAEGAI